MTATIIGVLIGGVVGIAIAIVLKAILDFNIGTHWTDDIEDEDLHN